MSDNKKTSDNLMSEIKSKLRDGDYIELYEIFNAMESGITKICSLGIYLVIAHWFYGSVSVLCVVYDNKVLYEAE